MSYHSRQIHFSKNEIWCYKIGTCYVRIYRPDRQERAARVVGKTDIEHEFGWLGQSTIKLYIRRYMRFSGLEIPEARRVTPFALKMAILGFFSTDFYD